MAGGGRGHYTTLGVTSLTSYISRIRRRETASRRFETSVGQFVHPHTESTPALLARAPRAIPVSNQAAPAQPDDPLAQAMRVLSKPKLDIRKVHNDGDPEGRNLI
jgi:hypothetical protein